MVYDAIVVGGGPGGGMAARVLAKNGFKVLIIDKRRALGDPVQCAEATTKFCMIENGITPRNEWIAQEVMGAKAITPNGCYFYAEEHGYSLYRVLFDSYVTYGAVDLGAELLLNNLSKGVYRKNGHYVVDTKQGEFEGRVIIGADGAGSKTADSLGLIRKRIIWNALEYKFRLEDLELSEPDWLSFWFGPEWDRGYAWAFPAGDEWRIGLGGFGHNKELMRMLLKRLKLDPDKQIGHSGGAIPHHYEMDIATDGVMIVGDAAGMTNPFTGGGIHAAMSAGRIAGEVGVEMLEKEDPTLTTKYVEKINHEPYMLPILYRCARYMQKWTEDDWNYFGKVWHGMDFGDISILKLFLAVLARPKYLLRSRELLLIRKAMDINLRYGW